MRVLKFGGKSLKKGIPITNVIDIIIEEHKYGSLAVVVSAIGSSTDQLTHLYELAVAGEEFNASYDAFIEYQNLDEYRLNLDTIFTELKEVLVALQQLKINSTRAKDRVLSFGELISAQLVTHILKSKNSKAQFVDARNLIKVEVSEKDFEIDKITSQQLTKHYFANAASDTISVITGFIASNEINETVTLGRNGSNYTATLIAFFTHAKEVQNWTDVDGVYTASPKYVTNAKRIDHLSFKEAHELANFGAKILHPKTIEPLMEREIPLKIYSSIDKKKEGTLIDSNGSEKGIKAVSVIEDLALVKIESNWINGKVGIDGRIFAILGKHNISIRLIAQASSERGIGFVINADDADLADKLLKKEFADDLEMGLISKIVIDKEMAVIAILGRHNYSLEKAIYGLRRNKIWMHLISNSISGEHISLVIDNSNLKKAVNIVHNQVFGVTKTLNVFALGKGVVGARFINQIIDTPEKLIEKRNLKINVVGVADSKKYIFNPEGFGSEWLETLGKSEHQNNLTDILHELKSSTLENVIFVDNTSSQTVAEAYLEILNSGLDIVASNKKANSSAYSYYQDIRNLVLKKGRYFLYETNVGAGLPIINTLQQMSNSADVVYKIRGVFSGSLSYIFNQFSERTDPITDIVLEARENGFTEPDPRDDLNGMDVARKLIILAREIGMKTEIEDIKVENLIPDELLNEDDFESFLSRKEVFDNHYDAIKQNINADEVLRYVGELDVQKNELSVALVKASKQSPLGNIKNADAIFEIYTEAYGEQPIVIQGAGAGAEVTARGVFGDLLRISEGK
ncbi:MAG: bifunctional aspartate kinase/homoserine dehydrogenase I [Cyclobacteriaceae bacterium]|nr:bifunctional aspartate kinase/homoserine dehydrogenase I [Cyclobacteriaceae bacterium]